MASALHLVGVLRLQAAGKGIHELRRLADGAAADHVDGGSVVAVCPVRAPGPGCAAAYEGQHFALVERVGRVAGPPADAGALGDALGGGGHNVPFRLITLFSGVVSVDHVLLTLRMTFGLVDSLGRLIES